MLISWENEALLAKKKMGSDQFEVIVPSISILAEPPVAVIAANAKKHGTEAVARAYLEYLYTPEAQVAIARNMTMEQANWGAFFASASLAVLVAMVPFFWLQRHYVKIVITNADR